MLDRLHFEPAGHVYTLDGHRIVSVTQAIEAAGLSGYEGIAPAVLAAAAARGNAVHAAVHYLLDDDLDLATLDPNLAPYLSAYQQFLEDSGFKPEAWEERVVNAPYRYAGTLDQRGALGSSKAIVDVKSGMVVSSVGLQLAGYQLARRAMGDPTPYRRFALQLTDEGKYKLHEHTDKRDQHIFLACVSIAHWKQEHGNGSNR